MKSLTNSKYYPWVVVALLGGVALLNYMDRQMLSTMKDSMQVDITDLQSAANFGRLMAVFLWIYGLMSPISGIIADNLSRKKLIVGSLLVWSSVTYFMGLATTSDQVFWGLVRLFTFLLGCLLLLIIIREALGRWPLVFT